jgi:hypothetical protein
VVVVRFTTKETQGQVERQLLVVALVEGFMQKAELKLTDRLELLIQAVVVVVVLVRLLVKLQPRLLVVRV